MQTKKQSLYESAVNIAIGYSIAIISQVIIFPIVGVEATFSQNIKIGILFTLVSFVRSYLIRRYFNKKQLNQYAGKRRGSYENRVT
jgi:hypothetical protein